jgi:hypothetical protein
MIGTIRSSPAKPPFPSMLIFRVFQHNPPICDIHHREPERPLHVDSRRSIVRNDRPQRVGAPERLSTMNVCFGSPLIRKPPFRFRPNIDIRLRPLCAHGAVIHPIVAAHSKRTLHWIPRPLWGERSFGSNERATGAHPCGTFSGGLAAFRLIPHCGMLARRILERSGGGKVDDFLRGVSYRTASIRWR